MASASASAGEQVRPKSQSPTHQSRLTFKKKGSPSPYGSCSDNAPLPSDFWCWAGRRPPGAVLVPLEPPRDALAFLYGANLRAGLPAEL